MEKMYLCIDVGGSAIKSAVIDESLNFLYKNSVPTPYEGTEAYLDTLEGVYRTAAAQYPELAGIAMAVPGVIDSRNGICISGGALTFVELLPLAARMKERCGLPVTIMNDAKSAALAEVTWGSLADCQDAVVLVFGTGIGGALVKDGEVHLGKHFAAGEFSWIMTSQNFDQEENSWAGLNGYTRLIRLAASAKGLKWDEVSTYDIFRWVEEGDEAASWALDKFTRDIAFMILNLQAIYDPERFAVGGGMSKQPLFIRSIQKNLEYFHRTCAFPVARPEVTPCRFYNDANLIGALGFFLSQNPQN